MIGASLAMRAPKTRGQVQMAIDTLRRLGATLIGLPDDYGLVLGPELVSNGDFSNGLTGWNNASTGTGTATVVSGQLSLYTLNASNAGKVNQPVATPGKTHRIRFTVVSGSAYVSLAGVGGNYPPGTYSLAWVPVGASLYIENPGFGTTCVVDNISVREIISAQHFIDSTGTQPVTAIGDLVGLTLDRMGTVSANLLAFPTDLTNAAWNVTAGSKAAIVGGTKFTPDATNGIHRVYQAYPALAGEVGIITVKVKADGVRYLYINGAAGWNIQLGLDMQTGAVVKTSATSSTTPVLGADGFWTVECRGIAPAANSSATVWLQANNVLASTDVSYTGNGTDGFIVQSCTFQKLTGNHATQATTASKPLVARVPKRLGPNLVSNGDFSNGTTGWTAGNSATLTSASGVLRVARNNVNDPYAFQLLTTIPGVSYQVTVTKFATGGGVGPNLEVGTSAGFSNLFGGAVGGGTVSAAFVATGASTFVNLRSYASSGTQYAEFDNISVQEVLEWSNALDFDGSNDLLTLPINTGTAGTFIVACIPQQNVWRQCMASGAQVPSVPGVRIGFNGAGQPSGTVADGTNGFAIASPTAAPLGVPLVMSLKWTSGSQSLYVNGSLVSTSSGTVAASTGGVIAIGAQQVGQDPFDGQLIDCVYAPSALDDNDRRTIENAFMQKAGVTL